MKVLFRHRDGDDWRCFCSLVDCSRDQATAIMNRMIEHCAPLGTQFTLVAQP